MKNIKRVTKSEVLTLHSSFAELNAIKLKELKEKQILDEQTRKRHYSFYMTHGYDYSPTIKDFEEEIVIQKINKRPNEYLLFLRGIKKIYGNAYFYYQIWGDRGTGYNRERLYGEILDIINTEIENNLTKYTSQTELIPSAKNNKQVLPNTLRRYRNYVDSYINLTKNEKLPTAKAEERTCEKYGISSKTLLRAIRAV